MKENFFPISPKDTNPDNPSHMVTSGEINTKEQNVFKLGDMVSVVTSAGVESDWQFMSYQGDKVVLGRTVKDSERIEQKIVLKGDIRKVE